MAFTLVAAMGVFFAALGAVCVVAPARAGWFLLGFATSPAKHMCRPCDPLPGGWRISPCRSEDALDLRVQSVWLGNVEHQGCPSADPVALAS